MLHDLPYKEHAISQWCYIGSSFIPTEHNAAGTHNKVSEFVPEMA